jgi:hypothetical protein
MRTPEREIPAGRERRVLGAQLIEEHACGALIETFRRAMSGPDVLI